MRFATPQLQQEWAVANTKCTKEMFYMILNETREFMKGNIQAIMDY